MQMGIKANAAENLKNPCGNGILFNLRPVF